MDKDLPKLDINNINSSFEEFSEDISDISKKMIGLGIEFVNKMSGGFILDKNDRFFTLRNSIQYRLNSILFHFSLLLKIQKQFSERINSNPIDGQKSVNYLHWGSEQQYSLFDSIVFHNVSLFDYLACLINYSCSGKYESKLKWNSIIKISHNVNGYLKSSDLKEVLQKWNKNFVNSLYSHRSDLIHYKMDFGSSAYTVNLIQQDASLEIEAPYRFIKSFKELKTISKDNRIMINYSVDWLIKNTISATNEIIEGISVFMELNRRVSVDNEIFKFVKPVARK